MFTIHTGRQAMGWSRKSGLVALVGCAAFLQQAKADPIEYLNQALTEVIAQASVLNLASYDYVPGNSMFGAFVKSSDSISLGMELTKGVNYMVLATADNDIADLDLSARTEYAMLAVDNERDATPVLHFTSSVSGRVTLTMRNYDTRNNGFCVMVVLQESGNSGFSLSRIAEGLDNVTRTYRAASLFATSFAQNGFCLFGGKIFQGGDYGIYNMKLDQGNYILLSAGSENVRDIDSYVVLQSSPGETTGRTMVEDVANDATPICSFKTQSWNNYYLRHKNIGSEGDGFVFSILLQS
jgi:hypothetical protein